MDYELKALSCLLLYPDAVLKDGLEEIREVVAGGKRIPNNQKTGVLSLIDHLKNTPMASLQKDYVATFDVGKRASLNLFEHMHGDSRERGAAMLRLKKLYEDRGLEVKSIEMPDYLPMFLEFLSGLSPQEASIYLNSAAAYIAALDRELRKEESQWQSVTAAVLALTDHKPEVIKPERDDLIPQTEAESFESPVRFSGNADPVQTIHFKK